MLPISADQLDSGVEDTGIEPLEIALLDEQGADALPLVSRGNAFCLCWREIALATGAGENHANILARRRLSVDAPWPGNQQRSKQQRPCERVTTTSIFRRSFCGTLRPLKAPPPGSDKAGDSVSVRREGATLVGPRI